MIEWVSFEGMSIILRSMLYELVFWYEYMPLPTDFYSLFCIYIKKVELNFKRIRAWVLGLIYSSKYFVLGYWYVFGFRTEDRFKLRLPKVFGTPLRYITTDKLESLCENSWALVFSKQVDIIDIVWLKTTSSSVPLI